MITMLKSWQGEVEINGKHYDSIKSATNDFKGFSGVIDIKLYPKQIAQPKTENTKDSKKAGSVKVEQQGSREVRITVKKYMTQKSSPQFDFMQKFNNDNPMPMRVMEGVVLQETRGMVKMKLHGTGIPTITCRCCGKELTNPISRHYGIGPICLDKLGIHREIDDVESIREELVNIEWEGWIVKSAITDQEEV